MSLLNYLNFGSTVLAFGCFSFAASNFGVKLGRVTSFINRSGYKYISDSGKSEELYEDIAKVAKEEGVKLDWATDKDKLRNWCAKYQKKARYWNDASKYCLVKNLVRHQLILQGYTLKEVEATVASSTSGNTATTVTTTTVEKPKCEDVWNSYADEKLDSLNYLYGKIHCATKPSNSDQSGTASS